jgi:hypothetical protein
MSPLPLARGSIAVDGADIAVSIVRTEDRRDEPEPGHRQIAGSFASVAAVDLLGREIDRVSAPAQIALTWNYGRSAASCSTERLRLDAVNRDARWDGE